MSYMIMYKAIFIVCNFSTSLIEYIVHVGYLSKCTCGSPCHELHGGLLCERPLLRRRRGHLVVVRRVPHFSISSLSFPKPSRRWSTVCIYVIRRRTTQIFLNCDSVIWCSLTMQCHALVASIMFFDWLSIKLDLPITLNLILNLI